MVDSATGFVCGGEEVKVLLVGSDIAVDEFDLGVAATKFSFQSLTGFVQQISEEDVCADGVKLTNQTGSDSQRAL